MKSCKHSTLGSSVYNKKISEFKSLIEKTIEYINKFPENMRETMIFDAWTLKDVVAHLNHWAQHDLNCLYALKNDEEPYWAPDVDLYNQEGVTARKNNSWEEVYTEFKKLTESVISELENLPDELWNKKFWSDRRFTPKLFLDIDIDHYKNEHLPELERESNKLKE
jgi:hypothetical protein